MMDDDRSWRVSGGEQEKRERREKFVFLHRCIRYIPEVMYTGIYILYEEKKLRLIQNHITKRKF